MFVFEFFALTCDTLSKTLNLFGAWSRKVSKKLHKEKNNNNPENYEVCHLETVARNCIFYSKLVFTGFIFIFMNYSVSYE